jgi:hypothetical protein
LSKSVFLGSFIKPPILESQASYKSLDVAGSFFCPKKKIGIIRNKRRRIKRVAVRNKTNHTVGPRYNNKARARPTALVVTATPDDTMMRAILLLAVVGSILGGGKTLIRKSQTKFEHGVCVCVRVVCEGSAYKL